MSTTLFLKRRLGGLFPADAQSEEAFGSISHGETVKAEIKRPRNVGHLRKFFALLNAVYPNQDTYPTLASFRAAVTVALGYGEQVKTKDGRTIIVPGSISFGKMDQGEFEQFFDKAVDLILTRIIPGLDRADLEREVNDILQGRQAA